MCCARNEATASTPEPEPDAPTVPPKVIVTHENLELVDLGDASWDTRTRGLRIIGRRVLCSMVDHYIAEPLVIEDSEIVSQGWTNVMMREGSGPIHATDSLFDHVGSVTGNGVWHLYGNHDDVASYRCELRGAADGVAHAGADWLFEDTTIHKLRYTDSTHNDGIQSYAGGLTLVRCHIDAGLFVDGAGVIHSNAALFQQGGTLITATDCYLSGGGYIVRSEGAGRIDLDGCTLGDYFFAPTIGNVNIT